MRFDNGYLKCDYRDTHDQRQWGKKSSTTGFYNHVLLHPTYIDTLALQKRKSLWYFRLHCEEMIQNPSVTWKKHLKIQQLYWAILLTEFRQSCTLVHSHSNIWRYSPATKITPVGRHIKRNSNTWNSGQFISEAQHYAVYILVPGGRVTLGGRTSDIYCRGSPAGPTDLLETTKTNSQGQTENKFSIHSLKFEFLTVSSPQLSHFIMLWEQL